MSYISRYKLRQAYEDCIKTKRQTENAINFEIDSDKLLEELYIELNIMTYKIGKSIVFTLYDKSKGGAHREVFAADFKDRIVHHLLINYIIDKLEQYEFINDNYACRINKGTLYGAQRCQYHVQEAVKEYGINKCYVLKADFKNFFCSLNKQLMYNYLKEFLDKHFINDRNYEWLLWLSRLIIFHCPQAKNNYIRKQPKRFWKGLPKHKCMFLCDELHSIAVGNLTSQILANLFLSKFDHYIVDILGYKHYGRYVDDFYMISDNKEKLIEDFKHLKEWVKYIDLELSPTKIYIQPIKRGVKFVGYEIYPNKFYIQRKSLYRFEHKIYKWNKQYEVNIKHNKNITLQEAKDILNTWNAHIGILSHTDNKNYYKYLFKKFNVFRNVILKVCTIDRYGYLHLNKQAKTLDKLQWVGIKSIKLKG